MASTVHLPSDSATVDISPTPISRRIKLGSASVVNVGDGPPGATRPLESIVILANNPTTVVVGELGEARVELPQVGPSGPAGRDGGVAVAAGVAGEPILAGRAVKLFGGVATLASNDSLANANLAGLASNTAAPGAPVTVTVSGEVQNSDWTWSAGAVFLSAEGALTQSVPTSGVVRRIGTAIAADTIILELGYLPVLLA